MRPRGIVEIPPIAQMNDNQAPSLYVERKKFALESLPSLLSYITINPDFVGVRYTEHWPRPYLLDENAGLVAFHFRKAVEEYLMIHENYRLSNKSTIMDSWEEVRPWPWQPTTANNTGIKVDKVYRWRSIDGLEHSGHMQRRTLPIHSNSYYWVERVLQLKSGLPRFY